MGQKTLKEMLKEANSSIQSINPNKAIDLVGNNEFIFIDLRDKSELLKSGIIAISLSLAAMLLYIWIRFEWQFSLGAILALFHDVILTLGIFSLFSLEINLSIVAAVLTIVGYSMNAFIPSGDSRNGLKQRLEYMQVAFVNPVVKLEDLDNTVSVFGDPGDK